MSGPHRQLTIALAVLAALGTAIYLFPEVKPWPAGKHWHERDLSCTDGWMIYEGPAYVDRPNPPDLLRSGLLNEDGRPLRVHDEMACVGSEWRPIEKPPFAQ